VIPHEQRLWTLEASRQPNTQLLSTIIRSNMPRVIAPSRAAVCMREDVIEDVGHDPKPNAFYDARLNMLRVYHGAEWGNTTSTLRPFPIPAALVEQANSVTLSSPSVSQFEDGTSHAFKAEDGAKSEVSRSQFIVSNSTTVDYLPRLTKL
jgi:hypothetical protein